MAKTNKQRVLDEINNGDSLINDYNSIQSDMSCNDGQIASDGCEALLNALYGVIKDLNDEDPLVQKLGEAIKKALDEEDEDE